MKTFHIKDLPAWIALMCAILLLSFTISFAQVINIPRPYIEHPVTPPPNPVPNPDPYFPPSVPKDTTGFNNFGSRFAADRPQPVSEIKNAGQLENLEIYPNPSDGQFTVLFHLNVTGDINIRITDILGNEITSQKLDNFSGDYNNAFDLSNKAKGIYMVSIEQNNNQLTKKVLIN